MKTLRVLRIAAISVIFASVSGIASAACSVDLRGAWQFYGELDGFGFSECHYTMDKDGYLEAGSLCDVYDELGLPTGWNNMLAEGRFVVNDDCSVDGTLTMLAVTLTIQRAKINNAKDAIRGVHRDDLFGGKTSLFTLFRVD